MERVYLDNAATSWPKPDSVYQAVDRYQRQVGAAAGRGAYRNAELAAGVVLSARSYAANLLGVKDPHRIVWCANGTDALNLAIHGVLRPGDRAVTTVCEHNSVLRPLAACRERMGVHVDYVDCDPQGYVDLDKFAKTLEQGPRLVVVAHASNVTGAVQPIAAISELTHQAGALLMVDAAQTVGHLPVDVEALQIDLLAASGHKGLLGPLGVGLLYVRQGVETRLDPFRQGGTGVESESEFQPATLPDRYEAGNLNVPALAGFAAGCRFVSERTPVALAAHQQRLVRQLIDGIEQIPGVVVYGPSSYQPRVGVVSVAVENYDPQDVAAALDASCGVECRAGLHCAPRMHAALGTLGSGGLVRFSPGWATTAEQIAVALEGLAGLAAAGV
ncbi:MAG: aminotransferase class V-fold PLP-dependent enzyme [Planctomycetales bacterium]|nr:aminotransferase class V-fold PLP-dependent enzyme [Planctomycetales bacterium]